MTKTQLTRNLEKRPAEEPEQTEAPKIHDITMNEEIQEEDQEFERPQEPIDPPQEKNPHKRKPAWVQNLSKVWKDMALQKRITAKERGLDPAMSM